MKIKEINGAKANVKRKAKGLRMYIRRLKQVERKGALPVTQKK